jgi:hypothetical protein
MGYFVFLKKVGEKISVELSEPGEIALYDTSTASAVFRDLGGVTMGLWGFAPRWLFRCKLSLW